jgi:hypothetical protein
MISMTFREFYDIGDDVLERYDDEPTIYVVRDGRDILYVGKSTVGIYNRWFDERGSHMYYWGTRSDQDIFGGRSFIGREIASKLPNSYEWYFDLWTTEEALNFLGFETFPDERKNGGYGIKSSFYYPQITRYANLKDAEDLMIVSLHPKCNVMNNNGSGHRELCRRYFEFIKGWESVR